MVLWDALIKVLPNDTSSYLFMGDFNAILSLNDKKKNVHSIGKRCNLFGNFVNSCNLQDLGYVGPVYTWQRGDILDRLDQAWQMTIGFHPFLNAWYRIYHVSS